MRLTENILDTNPGLQFLPKPNAGHRKTAIARRNHRGSGKLMLLKASQPKNPLIPEGAYPTTLSSIKGLPDEQKPKKVALGFKIKGYETEVTKELPLSFDDGKPLRQDVETLLGRELTSTEAQAGYDIDQLIGTPCQVVVMHKSGSGGKPQAVVSLIQPPGKTA